MVFGGYPTPFHIYQLEMKRRARNLQLILGPSEYASASWGAGRAHHAQHLPSIDSSGCFCSHRSEGICLLRFKDGEGPVTWLLFSAWLFLLESGKWMWQPVSSITFLMLLPPLPMTWECSVCETSIFNVTRLLCEEAGLRPDVLIPSDALPLWRFKQ